MINSYTDVINLIPESSTGCAEIRHDTPTQFERMRAALHGQPLYRDKYCRLLVRGQIMMTDAEFERKTNIEPIIRKGNSALIAGLGIGLILHPIICNFKNVTVVEKELDVIKLVAHHFPSVSIVHDDIFSWAPPKGSKFDLIYFDIWGDISSDDLVQSKELHRKFRKYLSKVGYMESWCRVALKYLR
jgi:spermidine synthase